MVAPIPGSRRILARLKFALLATISVTVGFLPLVLFRGYRVGFYLIVIAGLSLLISLALAIGLDPKNERPVSLLERAAIAVAALSEGSIIGLMLFLFYGVGWFLTVILDKIGWHPDWIDTIGTLVFNGFGFIFLIGVIGITTERLTKWLFPTTGIGNARLLPYIEGRQFSWTKLVVALFIIWVFVFCFFYIRFLFYVLCQFALIAMGTPVSQRLERRGTSDRTQTFRLAVKAMLEACGYTFVDRLQTQEIDFDRLLAIFDIVAYRNGYALAIQLKLGGQDDGPVSLTEASYLRTATRAAYKAISDTDIPVHKVLPMIMISERSADNKLQTFAEQESIRIGQIPEWSEVEALASNTFSEEELRQKAQSYLGIRSAYDTPVAQTTGGRS